MTLSVDLFEEHQTWTQSRGMGLSQHWQNSVLDVYKFSGSAKEVWGGPAISWPGHAATRILRHSLSNQKQDVFSCCPSSDRFLVPDGTRPQVGRATHVQNTRNFGRTPVWRRHSFCCFRWNR